MKPEDRKGCATAQIHCTRITCVSVTSKHVVRDRFVGQSLMGMCKSRCHHRNSLDTVGNIHVNYSSY